MSRQLEPLLHPVAIDHLRPTQITVGFGEVALKRAALKRMRRRKGGDYLGRHMIPVVIGPKKRPHLVDHHHLALALHQIGVKHVLVSIVADLSRLDKHAFRVFMDNRNWLHPFDAEGHRRHYSKLPRHIEDLEDDPYRSLAGALRRAGGCAKSQTPYAGFLWADFLRRRVPIGESGDVESILPDALALARSRAADYLPGWAGLDD
jgi:hypothetical protein